MADLPYRAGAVLAPYNDEKHLFIVMNDPCEDGDCLLIMVTSVKAHKKPDPACLLEAGDHPFVKHPSYMFYRMAEIIAAARIRSFLAKNYYVKRDDCPEDTFGRVAEGIYTSDNTRGRVRKYAERIGI